MTVALSRAPRLNAITCWALEAPGPKGFYSHSGRDVAWPFSCSECVWMIGFDVRIRGKSPTQACNPVCWSSKNILYLMFVWINSMLWSEALWCILTRRLDTVHMHIFLLTGRVGVCHWSWLSEGKVKAISYISSRVVWCRLLKQFRETAQKDRQKIRVSFTVSLLGQASGVCP